MARMRHFLKRCPAVLLSAALLAAAAGTAEKIAEVMKALEDGSVKVFDTATFTVGGEKLEDLIASNADYAKYEAYVSDGYFHESELASAPAFDIAIDGITMLG